MSLTPGTKLGQYEVVESIGAGGMGEVYRAHDTKLGRDVAIKVLPQEMTSDSRRLRRFEQEARAASALNHPNIVTIYEIGEHEGTPYIAMEYVDGVTLGDMLAGGVIPNDKLIRYATQMAEGLAKAHQAGIVHRDLKPENIIISDDGYVKILDFGLAKLLPAGVVGPEATTLAKETTPGTILGTVGYMSPEQAKGQPADFHSDQFSLGAILYEMATGTRAFDRESSAQTLAAIIEDDLQPVTLSNPSIPGQLASVIDRCLSKKPSERFESTWGLAKEIHSETLAIPEQPSGRHPLAAAGVGGLLAVILVMTLGLFVTDIRDWVRRGADVPRIESIAVLPLENLSGDLEQEYFADGMTEALITDLAKIKALKVISRTSAMRYKKSTKSAPEIAKELGVDALIEGTVLASGGQVRITAQLIDTATDQHLWAQTYERKLEDVLTLQREIALQIAGEVDASLTPAEEARLTSEYQVDAESYDAYLRGDYRMFSDTRASADTIVGSLERAIDLDPGFAPAYSRLADFLSFLSMRGFMEPAQSYLDARRLASKAVELDPSLAEARAVLARVLFQYEWDWPAAEREFGQALALNPNDVLTLDLYGAYEVLIRADCEGGLSKLERAVELDPFNEFQILDLGVYSGHCRRYDEAIRHLERALTLRPGLTIAEQFLAAWDSLNGSHEKALSRCQSLISRLDDDYDSFLLATCGVVSARAGKTREAGAILEQLRSPPDGVVVDPIERANVCAAIGDLDCAVEEIEAAYEARSSSMVFIRVAPSFDPLRSDPRFQEILVRMNFPE